MSLCQGHQVDGIDIASALFGIFLHLVVQGLLHEGEVLLRVDADVVGVVVVGEVLQVGAVIVADPDHGGEEAVGRIVAADSHHHTALGIGCHADALAHVDALAHHIGVAEEAAGHRLAEDDVGALHQVVHTAHHHLWREEFQVGGEALPYILLEVVLADGEDALGGPKVHQG